jgi:hypothetical protein
MTISAVVPVEQYVAGLNRKRTAAGVLFRDAQDRALLLQPSYKPNWEIPSGAGEPTSPRGHRDQGSRRGVGHDRPPVERAAGRGLRAAQDGRDEGVVFVFDGGLIDDMDLIGLSFTDGRSSPSSCVPSSGCARCYPGWRRHRRGLCRRCRAGNHHVLSASDL